MLDDDDEYPPTSYADGAAFFLIIGAIILGVSLYNWMYS
jgi:hypothetical protein